jgi:glycolate oxidase iron-sulfur subunit
LSPLSDAGALAPAAALELLPEVSVGNGKGRVGYLVGSLVNYAAPEIAQATVKVLNAAGYEVVTPKDQKCPGDLFTTLGDLDTAAALTAHNAAVFAGFDTVVTSCAATGAAAKNGFAGDDSGLSGKIKDVTELLVDGFAPRTQLARKVAYHDDCQLRAGMKVTKEPKALLTAAAGGNFVEMAAADSASGAGEGPFALFFAPISQRITAKKVERIVESKADVVASGNVAALLHLNEALERAGASARVKHTVELLAEVC